LEDPVGRSAPPAQNSPDRNLGLLTKHFLTRDWPSTGKIVFNILGFLFFFLLIFIEKVFVCVIFMRVL